MCFESPHQFCDALAKLKSINEVLITPWLFYVFWDTCKNIVDYECELKNEMSTPVHIHNRFTWRSLNSKNRLNGLIYCWAREIIISFAIFALIIVSWFLKRVCSKKVFRVINGAIASLSYQQFTVFYRLGAYSRDFKSETCNKTVIMLNYARCGSNLVRAVTLMHRECIRRVKCARLKVTAVRP